MYFFDVCSIEDPNTWDIVINYHDLRIDRFLNDMYEISCIESFKFFSKENNYDCKEDIEILKKYKDKIVRNLKDKIFESSKLKYKSITYNDLFELFKENFNENVNKIFFLIFLFLIF